MTEPIIKLDKLHISLPSQAGDVKILKNIDLQINKGEAVGVVGMSGSGKTTLLMALAGLEPATRGRIEVANYVYDGQCEDALARFRRTHIGIVFQSFHLVPSMTALENTVLPLELSHIGARKQIIDKAQNALDEVGLAHRLAHYPSQLSGGEQQRVALARAMITNPPILLADEPTGNLDETNSAQIIDLLFDLQRRRGATLILVTHNAALANRCDHIIHLHDGQIMQAGQAGQGENNE